MKRPLGLVVLLYGGGLLLGEFFQPPLSVLFAASLALTAVAVGFSRSRPILLGVLLVFTGWTNLVCRTAVICPLDLRRLLDQSPGTGGSARRVGGNASSPDHGSQRETEFPRTCPAPGHRDSLRRAMATGLRKRHHRNARRIARIILRRAGSHSHGHLGAAVNSAGRRFVRLSRLVAPAGNLFRAAGFRAGGLAFDFSNHSAACRRSVCRLGSRDPRQGFGGGGRSVATPLGNDAGLEVGLDRRDLRAVCSIRDDACFRNQWAAHCHDRGNSRQHLAGVSVAPIVVWSGGNSSALVLHGCHGMAAVGDPIERDDECHHRRLVDGDVQAIC